MTNIPLSEPEIELQLIGSLLTYPEASMAICDQIDPEWFGADDVRRWFISIKDFQSKGHRLTPQVAVSMVPLEICKDGVTQGEIFAHACAQAVSANYLSGLIETIKDRWARRELLANADYVRNHVHDQNTDPFDLAADSIGFLDTVNAGQGEIDAGQVGSVVDDVIHNSCRPDHARGATTGIRALDQSFNGYMRRKLYVVAGRPGMGKSAFMCSSLRRTAAGGHGVAIFSLEMDQQEIAARCLSDSLQSIMAPTFSSILRGTVSGSDAQMLREAQGALSDLPMYIDATPALTFSQIAGRARRQKAIFEAQGLPLSVIAIDHFGLVKPSNRYHGNKVAEAGEISMLAKALAKELDCAVVLLCQLSRRVEQRENKRPVLDDLRWTGDIEQDADLVAFLYRENYYLRFDPDPDPDQLSATQNKIEILIRKNRQGATEDVALWCSIAHSSIGDTV